MSATIFTKSRAAFKAGISAMAFITSTATFTSAGYAYLRAAGSFVADGFMVGDTVKASGFSTTTANGYARVTAVTESALTVSRPLGTATGTGATIIATAPNLFAYEGVRYSPTIGIPFLSESLQPIGAQVAAVGLTARIRHTFVHTVSLFYPSGEGPLSAERVAGGLIDKFRPGSYNWDVSPAQGIITAAERKPILVEPDWISLPVLVTVSVYTD